VVIFLIPWLDQAPRTNAATPKARFRLIYRTLRFTPTLFARPKD
jgi:hypothetical protein